MALTTDPPWDPRLQPGTRVRYKGPNVPGIIVRRFRRPRWIVQFDKALYGDGPGGKISVDQRNLEVIDEQ